jgi:hypothetical protein
MDMGAIFGIIGVFFGFLATGVSVYVNLRIKPLEDRISLYQGGDAEILKELKLINENIHDLQMKIIEKYVTYDVLPEKILTELHKHGLVTISKPK